MNYIRRHWRGELSLAVSFWINLVLVNIIIQLGAALTSVLPFNVHPKSAALAFLILACLWSFLLFPWQLVGIWRACRRRKETGRKFWPRATQAFIVLTIIATLFGQFSNWPAYRDLYKMVFLPDPIADYTINLVNDNTLIEVTGNFGFGLADGVAAMVAKNPGVTGVILNSTGGRLYEGRQLAGLIKDKNLDTYCLQGCYSACATAFIGGRKRYLARGANLGFHAYGVQSQSLRSFVDIQGEQRKDLKIYQSQEVAPEFLEKLFSTAGHNEVWFPAPEELLAANVIHEVVEPRDIVPARFQMESSQVEEALLKVPVFQIIRQYDPQAYEEIQKDFLAQLNLGLSAPQIQQTIGSSVERVALKSLARTSDEAIIEYSRAFVELLRFLGQDDPFLCLKKLNPEKYGDAPITDYLEHQQMAPMMGLLSRIIVEAFEQKNPPTNRDEAEEILRRIGADPAIDLMALAPEGLPDEAGARRTCEAATNLYEAILALDPKTSGNTLRYLFGKEP